ncbi:MULTISPECIES: pitrilysin family protein [Saccharopolyspora]|uniref:M16 family metallopeptidase n=1 Tax=Saccharopolyspora TaxID=1835 RepID=UPI001CD1A0DE|nr:MULTISPECIES: pitrilysin family protein [Saccharopolyspora]MCA1185527.1 insulinase family protein [Saccharopolyspora sp. 6T]MCA1192250.1 insulinase family protein [Saccharopolyspora sp. 6V]MCA1225134.1 insulinase family protein [Saccharopolyspora sp. 6M]MCA1283031.1 insulinase family protein [Saccharopolyspora sp. 7B]
MVEPPLHRVTLPNGLRVVLAPDSAQGASGQAPVVGVSVHYDVGFRSEPEGRTGFAHLFEHLMFQGSESLEKLAHFRHVQGSGGTFNGSTHQDYTDYFQVLPSAALERALFLEADRMRAPKLTEENLRNQVDVVKEEIRLNVLNRPYGGFPWILLPPVLYSTFANAHNGYGDFTDLEQATVDDCAAFFDTFYAPANAVLTIAGDFDVDHATELVHRHFGDVPAREVRSRPSFAEPFPTEQLTGVHTDPHAPLPAIALGHRLPDPVGELDQYLANIVLAAVLTDGDASRLQQRMVYREPLVVDVHAGCGLMGAPLDARDPDTFTLTAIHTPEVDAERVVAAVDAELESIAASGPTAEELSRVTSRWAASLHREHDRVISRTLDLGSAELIHGRAELISELPRRIAEVGADEVAAAAKALTPDARATLRVQPDSNSAGGAA